MITMSASIVEVIMVGYLISSVFPDSDKWKAWRPYSLCVARLCKCIWDWPLDTTEFRRQNNLNASWFGILLVVGKAIASTLMNG